ncbi:hypothetical protein KRR40_12695 [Niabella defluvii]|nr:hypothetical protein KRR40_12695 [Niabella sp. I65]
MDKKISELIEIGGLAAANDYLPLVRGSQNLKAPLSKLKVPAAYFADNASTANNALNAANAALANVARTLQSTNYTTSDFFGTGLKFGVDDDGKAFGVLDRLTVRERMTVNELAILKMQALGGTFVVTNAAKIKDVVGLHPNYTISIEDDSGTVFVPFEEDDIVACKTDNTTQAKDYTARITGSFHFFCLYYN